MKKWIEVDGLIYDDNEIELLQKYAKDKNVLEIGSYKGKTAVAMAEVAKSVLCVDTFKGNEVGSQYQKDEYTTLDDFIKNIDGYDNIQYIIGDSFDIVGSLDRVFDFIFIDGWHEKDGVIIDVKNCIKCSHKDTIIALHDCLAPSPHIGVGMACEKMFNGKYIDSATTIAVYKRSQYEG